MALPVSLEEAKTQLRVFSAVQNTEIQGFIQDAAAWVEGYTGHILEAREVTEQFRGHRAGFLSAWPISVGTVPVVSYASADGSPVLLAGARLDLSRRPARVLPAVGSFWPCRDSSHLFTVTLRAGYESPADVPRNLRRAMLVLISAYNVDREGGDVLAAAEKSARSLCKNFKRNTL